MQRCLRHTSCVFLSALIGLVLFVPVALSQTATESAWGTAFDAQDETSAEILNRAAGGQEATAAMEERKTEHQTDRGPRLRFVSHFMSTDEGMGHVPLLYASPRAWEWPFERELRDVRSAEALVRNWTRYRDDEVLVEMDPLSTSVRIVLPFNRATRSPER